MQKVIKAIGDDFTELNKELQAGYSIINTHQSFDGNFIFVLYKSTGAI